MSPISLTSGIVAAAAVGILYALHHLRIQPQQQKTATLIFWRHAFRQQQSTRLWSKNFRNPWTFSILAAILILLATALSADRWKTSNYVADVIVIDCGSSMGRGDQFVHVRQQVENQIRDAVVTPSIIVAKDQPRVLTNANEPNAILYQKVNALVPADSVSSSFLSLQLANSLLANGIGSIDWYTEQSALPVELPPQIAARVRTHRVPPSDAAVITSISFEPIVADPYHGNLRVIVAANAAHGQQISVDLLANNSLSKTQLIALSSASVVATFDGIAADGSEINLHLRGVAGNPSEQVASFRLPRRSPLLFTVMGKIPQPLMDALRSLGTIRNTPTEGTITVIGSDISDNTASGPTIRLMADKSERTPSTITIADLNDADLDLEHAKSLDTVILPAEFMPVLRDGRSTLWGINDRLHSLIMSSSSVDEFSDLTKRAAFPVLMQRLCGRLVGWSEASLVLDRERVANDPLWARDPQPCVVTTAPITAGLHSKFQPAHSHWFRIASWTDLILFVCFGLIGAESLLVAAKKIA